MRKQDLKRYLKPLSIHGSRQSTINGVFAAALLPYEAYDDARVSEALALLDQDPDGELDCVYCGDLAKTWDHLVHVSKKGLPNGPGHRMGNLVPCCKDCNSSKGGKDWEEFLATRISEPSRRAIVMLRLKQYQARFEATPVCLDPDGDERLRDYFALRDAVLTLMKQADRLAQEIRARGGSAAPSGEGEPGK